ncbi:MAG: hypothetical protein MSJ26_02395 [Oscillospiraceae bacterium]|nr:hypothetical protein [Oscillospiraceae bacterium]
MKASKKAAKFKGAALLLVLSVMVVLIIMIAGTLSIVASTYNRTTIKYEESQAYYSARSGLEAMWKTLMQDSIHTDDTGVAKPVSDTTPSQGLIIQEAIIGKLVDSGTSVTYNCSDSLKALYGTPAPSNVEDTYLEFKMNLSQLNALSASEGGVGQQDATVRVQLLELFYDDGNDATAGIDRNSVTGSVTADLTAGSKQAQYIKSCRIKIACTVYDTLSNSPVTVSVELEPYVAERSTGSGTVSTGSSSFDNGILYGGTVSAGDQSWGNDSIVVGSVFVNGDINATVAKLIYLKADESVVINGKYNASAPQSKIIVEPIEPTNTSQKEHPYVFIKDTATMPNDATFGKNTGKDWSKVDLVCRGMFTLGSASRLPYVYGNTYIDGPLQINWSSISLDSTPDFDGDLFISDREAVTKYDYANQKFVDDSGDKIEKTDLGIFMPINIGTVSNPILVPYYEKGDNVYFNIRDKENKFYKVLVGRDLSVSLDSFCNGKIYYYYKNITNGFEGAWEFEAIRKFLDAASSGKAYVLNSATDNPSEASYTGQMLSTYDANVSVVNMPSSSKFKSVNSDKLKYICQLENASEFLEGATVSSSSLSLDDPNQNISYKYYMSLPVNDTESTSWNNADELKRSKLVPTLFSEYSEYLMLNVPKTLTKSEIDNPSAADPANPDNLWVKGVDKFDFIKADRSAAIEDITYWDPFSGTSGAQVIQNWKAALGAAAYHTTYTPDQKLDLVSNILNAVYKVGTDGKNYTEVPTGEYEGKWDPIQNKFIMIPKTKKQMNAQNVFFMSPALACAENDNIIFDNFNSVASVNQSATEEKGLTVNSYTGGSISIDTTSNEAVVILKPGSYSNITVTGNNFAYVLMESGTYYFNNTKVVDDFYGSLSSNINYVHSGSKTNYTNLKSPRTLIYADDGVNIQCSNNCRIAAYIYGPLAKLNLAMSSGGPSNIKILYNLSGQYKGAEIYQGLLSGNPVTIDIAGSLFLREINGANNASSLYIPLDPSNASPGSPTIKWTQIKYSNTDIKTS